MHLDEDLKLIHKDLGITEKHYQLNKLSPQQQPLLRELEVVDLDFEGKPFLLTQAAAKSWRDMVQAAQQENIHLHPYSGFRSYLHQKRLIEHHLKNGRSIDDILTHIALPGFSEHHTGFAVDIHAPNRPLLEEAFENTLEFHWLQKNANRFHFYLSYPRHNKMGIIYEPWHWLYK